MRRGGIDPLSEVLSRLLREMPNGERLAESMALAHWAEVVGPAGAAASRAVRIREGVLTVETRSSTWSQELSLHRERLIAELNARLGRPLVRKITFRVGGGREP